MDFLFFHGLLFDTEHGHGNANHGVCRINDVGDVFWTSSHHDHDVHEKVQGRGYKLGHNVFTVSEKGKDGGDKSEQRNRGIHDDRNGACIGIVREEEKQDGPRDRINENDAEDSGEV